MSWVVVVAQLAEQSLMIAEIHCWNPINLNWTFVYCQLYWKDENKEKEAINGLFKNVKGIKAAYLCYIRPYVACLPIILGSYLY